MKTKTAILETLTRINAAIAADANALTTTRAGEVSPERAYIELVRELLALDAPEAAGPVVVSIAMDASAAIAGAKEAQQAAGNLAAKATKKARTVTKPAAKAPTVKNIRAASIRLQSSARGRDCATHMRALFHESASLDKENKEAAQTIIAGFFGNFTGEALEAVKL